MNWEGVVVSVHIAPAAGAPPVSIGQVRAVPGKGLEGDRYFAGAGTFSDRPGPAREVTLIEIEAVEALSREYRIELDPGDSRRNLVTRGVPLNHLVGREFHVGDAVLRGIRLAEPCNHLARLTGKKDVLGGLVHRGGLRAQIVAGGVIRVGARVRPTADAAQ